MINSRKSWWEQDEQKRQEAEELKDEILNKFWEIHVTNSNETYTGPLKGFLKGIPPKGLSREDWSSVLEGEMQYENYPPFNEVIINKNKKQFDYLFKHVQPIAVLSIDEGEGFGIAAKKREKYVDVPKEAVAKTLSNSDIEAINQYMKDTNMSAVTSISSNNHIVTISTEGNNENCVFSIHSVGKIMTGVLVLLFLEKGILQTKDLDEPIQINPELVKQLEESHPLIAEQLKKVTLHEVMTHQGGFVDFMAGYVRSINSAKAPIIKNISDFLSYAKDQVNKGGQEYSNLGSLFVGLALEHAYENYRKNHQDQQPLNFYGLINEFIKNEAGMTNLSESAPQGAKVNLNNEIEEPTPEAPYLVASPCGGFWTSSDDLRKFGEWLYKKCKNGQEDTPFMNLVKRYGEEFYNEKTNSIEHPGENPSASAMLSVSLNTGTVIATLSNSSRTDAHDLEAAINRNIFTQEVVIAKKELNSKKELISSSSSFFSHSKKSLSGNTDNQDKTKIQVFRKRGG